MSADIKPPVPANEKDRLIALKQYKLLDTQRELIYDNLTYLAAKTLDVPITLISLISEDRQWFKSVYGLEGVNETARDIAFCSYTILNQELLEVQDALADHRFSKNPLVTGEPKIRFYAGAPLTNRDGFTLGTLCIIDQKPKKLTPEQKEIFKKLSQIVMGIFEMSKDFRDSLAQKQQLTQQLDTLRQKYKN